VSTRQTEHRPPEVTGQRPESAVDFYTDNVLSLLAERLDQAFPEFGWRRDARGWVATNEEHTHASLGVRADRVVAHGPAPRGFLVHGGDAVLWTAYVSGGAAPRGEEFVRAVRELARRAGVDTAPIDRQERPDRRAELLERFVDICHLELMGDRGERAREYLHHRGLVADVVERSRLGLVPSTNQIQQALHGAGFQAAEVAAAGVCADSRWPGRLCGSWATASGRAATLWARSIETEAAADPRYLYLRGTSRTNLPPYGLSDVLAGSPDLRRDLVLVEGFFDVHQLRAHGIENGVALGGLAVRPKTFEQLARWGVEHVTVCLDRDGPGRMALARVVENSVRAQVSPVVLVVDPERLAPAKDPDDLVRNGGSTAWSGVIGTRECGIAWRATELLNGVTVDSAQDDRRRALERAGSWLGKLPARLALEQEDAVRLVAERCGYSPPAAERAFRARFWQSRNLDVGRTL
jgi:DNA primase